jgi:hypothetical protein
VNRFFLLAAAIVSMGAAACGPDYSKTNITSVVPGAPGNEINNNHVTVAEGTVLKAHIESTNTSNDKMGNVLQTDDPSIADVTYVVSDHDWLFFGNKVGQTHITIKANEDTVIILDALVVAQPASP